MLHIYYCCWRVVTRSHYDVMFIGIWFEDWTFIFLNVHSIVYIIHFQSSNFRLSYTVDVPMFEILSVNPITNVTIHRSLFQWSEKKFMILLPCQNSLSPTHTQPFIPTISTNIPTLSSLILRIGATIGSTMVKDGECLTRAWSLSIK